MRIHITVHLSVNVIITSMKRKTLLFTLQAFPIKMKMRDMQIKVIKFKSTRKKRYTVCDKF